MTAAVGKTEVWQARIEHELATELRADAEILGLKGRTDLVKAGLQLLHKLAAEERMARGIDEFYGGATPPLPIGVLPAGDETVDGASTDRAANGTDDPA